MTYRIEGVGENKLIREQLAQPKLLNQRGRLSVNTRAIVGNKTKYRKRMR